MGNELVPYSDIEKMGKAVASSGLFGVKTEAQAVALMLIAQAYGQHPAIAAMEYHIIAGKPSKKSEAMLASFIQAGGKVQWHKLDDTIADATFTHPSGGELRLAWDIKMAEKAGLLSKEGTLYKKYPRAMLRSRLIAEGVRTIYPAATGGMLAKEEIEDIELSDIKQDPTKSRLENIVDSHIDPPKEEKRKSTRKVAEKPEDAEIVKPIDDIKTVVGVIEGIPEVQTINKDGKNVEKYRFIIDNKYYGTFDIKLFNTITDMIDKGGKGILIKFEYKERKTTKGNILNDIVSFEQVTADTVPID